MRKKSLVGWMYKDDELEFKSISAWRDSPLGVYVCLLKHKKGIGKFDCKKVRITIEEVK